jgi:hypothetical protein
MNRLSLRSRWHKLEANLGGIFVKNMGGAPFSVAARRIQSSIGHIAPCGNML